MMRIALFVHCYYPEHFYGTEAYTRLIALELKRLGHQPSVVTATFYGEPEQSAPIERYTIDDIPVFRIDKNPVPHRNLAETYCQPAMADIHRDLMKEIKPDVIHVCHLINHTSALLAVASEMAIPTFATFTDFFGFCFNNKLQAADGSLCPGPSPSRDNCIACLLKETPASTPIRRLIQHPLLRPHTARVLAALPGLAGESRTQIQDLILRPDRLAESYRIYRAAIAPSRFLRDAYIRNGFAEPLILSHFGVDIDRRSKPAREDSMLRVAYIGQIAPHKGVHLLVEAFSALARGETATRIRLEIFGEEKQDPSYARRLRAASEGLPVHFRGTFPASDTADILAKIDVLALPSTWPENSPLILLQALATHTPVIVSNMAGLTEFLSEGTNGFSFPCGDSVALAERLNRFIADPSLAARLSASTVYERTPRHMALDILRLYADHGLRVETDHYVRHCDK